MKEIVFSLPFLLQTLNERDRTNRWQKGRDKKALNLEVMAAIGGPRYFPRPPIRKATIVITRCSSGRVDPDNLAASAKNLLDVLCVRSGIHPSGLSIIEDDNPRNIELVTNQTKAAPGEGVTLVRIIPND